MLRAAPPACEERCGCCEWRWQLPPRIKLWQGTRLNLRQPSKVPVSNIHRKREGNTGEAAAQARLKQVVQKKANAADRIKANAGRQRRKWKILGGRKAEEMIPNLLDTMRRIMAPAAFLQEPLADPHAITAQPSHARTNRCRPLSALPPSVPHVCCCRWAGRRPLRPRRPAAAAIAAARAGRGLLLPLLGSLLRSLLVGAHVILPWWVHQRLARGWRCRGTQ